ncbi:MAG: hypothetical protein HQ517_12825 [SAR324 cluster bacterium]|nr:hypothetical protein [SAR324 cluster bacterium]
MRNGSKRPFVPVLILDITNRITTGNQKMGLDLLIGLKKDAAGNFSLAAPSYRLDSLNDPATLSTILCAVMGIDENSVPSFAVSQDRRNEEDEFKVAMESGNLSDSPQGDKTAQKSELPGGEKNKPLATSTSKSGSIQVFPAREKPEEIYTLGSLFSFNDETASAPAGIPESPDQPDQPDQPDESGNTKKATPEPLEPPATEEIKPPETEEIKHRKPLIF